MNIKFVVCQIGIGDILENRDDSVNSLEKNYQELLIRLMELHQNAKVGTSGLVINPEEQNRDTKLQNDVVQVNRSMRKFCTDQNNKSLKYIGHRNMHYKKGLFTDDIHINKDGRRLLVGSIHSTLIARTGTFERNEQQTK